MGRPSKTRRLRVMMNGEHVGEWTLRPNGMHEFAYGSSWLISPNSRPLSLSMPLRGEPYSGEAVYAYFDNLLPNNDTIRRRIQNRFAARGIDPFSLLRETGRDCVGAIQLIPADEACPDVHTISATPVDDAAVAAVLRGTTETASFGQKEPVGDEFRISLAGAQEKTALLRHDGRWMVPHGTTPSTHILKLPLGHIGAYSIDMTTSIENEWLSLKILEGLGLPVAGAAIECFDGMKALVVERFDRKLSQDGSWIVRLPQEDLCQATGTPPWQKYEHDGGPGVEIVMELLLSSERAREDRELFFRTQVALVLLAAIDAHAKNFSIFLGPKGTFRLTPLYDVLSAYPVIGSGPNRLSQRKITMAMAMWGKTRVYRWEHVTRRHLITTATACGLGQESAESIIDDLCRRADKALEQASRALPPGFPTEVAETIFRGVGECARRLG